MCGICGITWQNKSVLATMVRELRHRGPDDRGEYVDDRVSLGQTRLSIVDLTAAGHQPMESDDGQVVLVYNGEIYNHRDLRAELIGLGHKFRGTSDTEVFLRSYTQWGIKSFSRFNGMWAACVYDKRTAEVILTRDRIGVKPLYYHIDKHHRLVFASELKAILTLGMPREVDTESIDLLLSTQFIPSPRTAFKGIFKLEPRQYLTWNLTDGSHRLRYHYNIPKYNPNNDRSELIREGRRLLEDAVRIRLEADVPVGAFLSGGIDSTTVVAEMRNWVEGQRLHTVSVGFDNPGLDESEYIHIARKQFDTNHHHVVFNTSDTDRLADSIAQVYDEPVADPSSFPTYLLCEETRKWMKVALSGDGGDEVFGGYGGRKVVSQFVTLSRIPRPLRSIGHAVISKCYGYDLTRVGQLAEALRVSLLPKEEYAGEIGARLVYRPPAFKAWTRAKLQELLPLANGSLLEAMLKFDIHYNKLGDNYAAKVDRMSMAHGLEVRSPFFDFRLMEFASTIPLRWKMTGRATKILMKEIIRGMIPDSIIDREKHGFAGPLSAWIAKNEQVMKDAVETLTRAGVLNAEWRRFYLERVFGSRQGVYVEFAKRLYFLWRWYQTWVEGRETAAELPAGNGRAHGIGSDSLPLGVQ